MKKRIISIVVLALAACLIILFAWISKPFIGGGRIFAGAVVLTLSDKDFVKIDSGGYVFMSKKSSRDAIMERYDIPYPECHGSLEYNGRQYPLNIYQSMKIFDIFKLDDPLPPEAYE